MPRPRFYHREYLLRSSESYSFTLPTCLPDGEYLLRIQNIGIHNPYPAGTPQVRVPPVILRRLCF
ncbi:hypothetical protein IMZ48_20530 [Candidatus Bathyarchaeota archaeon]|nr:hypothetical protein [Candidatus Bathyarchaeota archaeon]